MIFSYQRSPHESVVDQLFGQCAPITCPVSAPLRCVIMAFVNRSGSNYIADVLKTTGRFVGFEEMLNDTVISALTAKHGIGSFVEYIQHVYAEQVKQPSHIWGVKAGAAQLAMLSRLGIVPHVLQPSVILVRRRDVIGQAISFLIAEQTQRWTTLDRENNKEVVYDGQRILLHLRGISNSYAMLEQMLTVLRLPVHTVIYEDFLDRPNEIISQLGLAIAGEGLLPRFDKTRISQQRGALTESFRERFRDDALAIKWVSQ